MSTKITIKPRKHKHKDEIMKKEIVVQVHKTINSDQDKYNKNDSNSNRTNTPSREVSVDEESQINSKILSLIESEIKRDGISKSTHFTDSRPQSLSFYEDEKVPEELSGNLELLSPEERKHYKRRSREHQLDEERSTYNVVQDPYNNKDEEAIVVQKKLKSKKKRHEGESGMGDSREMMIPKEKRKNKKKKRDSSPNKKIKHKKLDDGSSRTDITLALEELQDDVFDNNKTDEYLQQQRNDKIKKSPRKTDKLYVQRKNKFEITTSKTYLNRQGAYDLDDDTNKYKYYPIEVALTIQIYWMRFTNLCHGLLGGLAFGHWLYIISNYHNQNDEFILHYSYFSDIYVTMFYLLSTICIISVFEKLDIAHFNYAQIKNVLQSKIITTVAIFYISCLIIHLSIAEIDYKFSLTSYFNNETVTNITNNELLRWNYLSSLRSLFAFIAWIILGLSPQENMFYIHLKQMEKYLPDK